MAGSVKITGLSGLRGKLGRYIKDHEKYVVNRRVDVVNFLLEELMKNIPVWSGRTIRSIRISTSETFAPLEPTPDPSLWASFGKTNQMPMGAEPMRESAEGTARAQLANAQAAKFKDKLYLTINSTAWDLVEHAMAPGAPKQARNRAVVTELALAAVKAKFKGVK